MKRQLYPSLCDNYARANTPRGGNLPVGRDIERKYARQQVRKNNNSASHRSVGLEKPLEPEIIGSAKPEPLSNAEKMNGRECTRSNEAREQRSNVKAEGSSSKVQVVLHKRTTRFVQAQTPFTFWVNGQPHQVDQVEPNMTLNEYLRSLRKSVTFWWKCEQKINVRCSRFYGHQKNVRRGRLWRLYRDDISTRR